MFPKIFLTFLLATATCFGSSLFGGEKLTDSYIPAAIQLSMYHLYQLEYYPFETNVVLVYNKEQNGVVYVHFTDFDGSPKGKVRESQEMLTSLLVNLNKDAKKQGLDKFEGYAADFLKTLAKTSTMNAPQQYKTIISNITLSKVGEPTQKAIDKINKDLDNPKSNLTQDLSLLMPLQYLVLKKSVMDG